MTTATPEFLLPAIRENRKAMDEALAGKSHIELALAGFRPVTMFIVYGLPDHPLLVNEFIHQLYDISPSWPACRRFIEFWQREIEGPLKKVFVDPGPPLISPSDWRKVDHELHLN